MSARNKLNAANINGVLFVAGLLGLVTGSGVVFLLAAAVMFAHRLAGGRHPLRQLTPTNKRQRSHSKSQAGRGFRPAFSVAAHLEQRRP